MTQIVHARMRGHVRCLLHLLVMVMRRFAHWHEDVAFDSTPVSRVTYPSVVREVPHVLAIRERLGVRSAQLRTREQPLGREPRTIRPQTQGLHLGESHTLHLEAVLRASAEGATRGGGCRRGCVRGIASWVGARR